MRILAWGCCTHRTVPRLQCYLHAGYEQHRRGPRKAASAHVHSRPGLRLREGEAGPRPARGPGRRGRGSGSGPAGGSRCRSWPWTGRTRPGLRVWARIRVLPAGRTGSRGGCRVRVRVRTARAGQAAAPGPLPRPPPADPGPTHTRGSCSGGAPRLWNTPSTNTPFLPRQRR